jgi:hypothetical protein
MNELLDRIRRRGVAPVAGAALAGLALLAVAGASAQSTSSPSAASAQIQSEIFKNLPEDQQKAILEQMRRGGVPKGKREKLEFPTTDKQKSEKTDQELEDEFGRFLEPKLKKGDTVVLDVSVRFPGDTRDQEELDKELVDQQERDKLDPAKNVQIDPKAARLEALRQERADRNKREAIKKAHKRTDDEQEFLEKLRLRIIDANPYKLSDTGALEIPGVIGIPLLGLNEEQATKRLLAEPALRDLRIRLTRLPLERQGVDALKPFGYELFKTVPSTFAPVSDTPVPSEYILGPGDTITLQLVGSATDRDLTLQVGRDGRIQIPNIGSVAVGGMQFGDARRLIEQRVASRMSSPAPTRSAHCRRSPTRFSQPAVSSR